MRPSAPAVTAPRPSTRRCAPRSANACGSSTTSPGRWTTTSCRSPTSRSCRWATASIIGVEALARWTHPERGRVAPDVFIAVAEETGLIDVLGERVLALACTDADRWADAIPGFRVSVNLSPRQLRHGRVRGDGQPDARAHRSPVQRAAARGHGDERMSDRPCTRENLRAIAHSGIGLALDDFGTGFSSLSYLASSSSTRSSSIAASSAARPAQRVTRSWRPWRASAPRPALA